jgi:RHS repeat-associated protein
MPHTKIFGFREGTYGCFGIAEKNRGSAYAYGFNWKENDNEVKGEGNWQDYGFRIYDPRLGKFLSIDPLTRSYPWYTPYQFAGNKPIWCDDLDGAEERVVTKYKNTKGVIVTKEIARMDEKDGMKKIQLIYSSFHGIESKSIVWVKGKREYGQGGKQPVYKGTLVIDATDPNTMHLSYDPSPAKSIDKGAIVKNNYANPSTGEILKGAANNPEFQKAGQTVKNVLTGMSLAFGVAELAAIGELGIVQKVSTLADVAADVDDLNQQFIPQVSSSVIPNEYAQGTIELVKTGVDIWNRGGGIVDLGTNGANANNIANISLGTIQTVTGAQEAATKLESANK